MFLLHAFSSPVRLAVLGALALASALTWPAIRPGRAANAAPEPAAHLIWALYPFSPAGELRIHTIEPADPVHGRRIVVHPSQCRQLTGGPNTAGQLFDGDPATAWFPGWKAEDYPARALVDLGAAYRLTRLRILDGTGQPRLEFRAHDGEKAAAQPFLSVTLDQYDQWKEPAADVGTRFVEVSLHGVEGDRVVKEIEFYGEPAGTAGPESQVSGPDEKTAPLPSPALRRAATPADRGAAGQIGLNGFHWVPLSLLQPFALFREYQMTGWLWTPDGLMFQPSAQGNGNFDDHYRALKDAGITVVPCLNKIPAWLLDGRTSDPDWDYFKPLRPGRPAADPMSYREISAFFFQVAARYGRQVHPPESLRVNQTPRWTNDPPNELKSGLDLLEYLEVENEPNRWWKPAHARYTPEEYAALLSACYDGHEGRLGPGHGIKTADPTMKVVMAGLANLNRPYLQAMLEWFRRNRQDRQFAADVINVHHYSNEGNRPDQYEVNFTHGIHPEADDLREKLRALVRWRDRETPGKPFWYSEFGYDTRPPSVQRAVPYGRHDAEEIQGLWLVRGYLEALAAGCDAVMMFNAIDENSAHGGGLYASSGLAQGEHPQPPGQPFQPKASWKMVADLVAALEGYRFTDDLSPSPAVRVYAFRRDGKTKVVYWSPTAADVQTYVTLGAAALPVTEWPQFLQL